MEDYLREQLVSMGPAAAKNFHDILQTYEDLADQYGLWDAVSVIKEYGCSDDGFIDFRAWLTPQGKKEGKGRECRIPLAGVPSFNSNAAVVYFLSEREKNWHRHAFILLRAVSTTAGSMDRRSRKICCVRV